jgi:DNA-nicking Smr family endonuclease
MRDIDQFLNAMDNLGVTPMNEERAVAKRKAALERLHPQEEEVAISSDDSALFLNAVMNMGVTPKVDEDENRRSREPNFSKLRSAKKKKPDEFVDLHGMTVREALDTLAPFVTQAYTRGLKTAAVITGKGLHSPGGRSVLKPQVERWIQTKGKRFIRAYAEAPRAFGGRGAFMIYFRED